MAQSAEEAAEIARRHLENPSWESAVTQVDDAGSTWRVFFNSRVYVETGEISHALAGNLPLLVDKATGVVECDNSYLPSWKARVHLVLVGTDEGGRSRPVQSGYRPSWRSERKPAWNDAAIQLDGVPGLRPGDRAPAWLLPGVPHSWAGRILPGDHLEGGEGSRIVVTAHVLEISLWHANDFRTTTPGSE